MREREVAYTLDGLEALFIFFSLFLFVLENLVSHDESIGLVRLVLCFVLELLPHELFLHVEQTLLVFTLFDLVEQLAVTLFVNLVDDLAKHVVIVASVKVHALAESVTHLAVNEGRHERIWKRLSLTHGQRLR